MDNLLGVKIKVRTKYSASTPAVRRVDVFINIARLLVNHEGGG